MLVTPRPLVRKLRPHQTPLNFGDGKFLERVVDQLATGQPPPAGLVQIGAAMASVIGEGASQNLAGLIMNRLDAKRIHQVYFQWLRQEVLGWHGRVIQNSDGPITPMYLMFQYVSPRRARAGFWGLACGVLGRGTGPGFWPGALARGTGPGVRARAGFWAWRARDAGTNCAYLRAVGGLGCVTGTTFLRLRGGSST